MHCSVASSQLRARRNCPGSLRGKAERGGGNVESIESLSRRYACTHRVSLVAVDRHLSVLERVCCDIFESLILNLLNQRIRESDCVKRRIYTPRTLLSLSLCLSLFFLPLHGVSLSICSANSISICRASVTLQPRVSSPSIRDTFPRFLVSDWTD